MGNFYSSILCYYIISKGLFKQMSIVLSIIEFHANMKEGISIISYIQLIVDC